MKELKLMSETEEGTQKIYKAFMSFNIVSEACTSIINTKLDAPPMDEPWFYELQNELNESVKKADFWLNDIASDIQYKIPECITNYSNEYIKTSNSINEIITEKPNMQKGDEAFNEVMNKLQSLLDFGNHMLNNDMKQVLSSISSVESDFRNIGSQMKVTLSKAQQSEMEIRGDIDRLNTNISYLYNLIGQKKREVERYRRNMGFLFFIVRYKVETLERDIIKQEYEIGRYQQMISKDQQLLASLQAIEKSTDNTISSLENASKSVNDIEIIWQSFIKILNGVINDLKKVEESPIAIIKKVFTKAALSQWEDIYKFAQELISANAKV